LNAAAARTPALAGLSVPDLLTKATVDASLPASARLAARNQAGGFANHALYFRTLGPNATAASGPPGGEFGDAVARDFGSVGNLTDSLAAAAASFFGSGWSWLTVGDGSNATAPVLAVETTPNQDNPVMAGLGYSGRVPIFGVDVWEHAYYVDYGPNRTAHVKGVLNNLVNWTAVGENYGAARQGDVQAALLG
jgi:superoxide dismutase, Fe-Mn family